MSIAKKDQEPETQSDDGKDDSKTYKYRDFSAEPNLPMSELTPADFGTFGKLSPSIRSQRFPLKLHAILAQKQFSHIITWMPHGRSWKVLNPGLLETEVLPICFDNPNYNSFNRIVNAWCFRRISSGPDRGSYYHEMFLRGKPHLHMHMRRLPRNSRKMPMKQSDEPKFYKMKPSLPASELVAHNTISGQAAAANELAIAAASGLTWPTLNLPNIGGLSALHYPVAAAPIALPPQHVSSAGLAYGGRGLDAILEMVDNSRAAARSQNILSLGRGATGFPSLGIQGLGSAGLGSAGLGLTGFGSPGIGASSLISSTPLPTLPAPTRSAAGTDIRSLDLKLLDAMRNNRGVNLTNKPPL